MQFVNTTTFMPPQHLHAATACHRCWLTSY